VLRAGEANRLAGVGAATGAAVGALLTGDDDNTATKDKAKAAAFFGSAGYGYGSAANSVTNFAQNVAKGTPREKSSWSDFAPLAVGAAVGGTTYFKPEIINKVNPFEDVKPKDKLESLGFGTAAYGATAALRDGGASRRVPGVQQERRPRAETREKERVQQKTSLNTHAHTKRRRRGCDAYENKLYV
jgi:hypothetical protein